jgi:hypothetical protein
MNSPTFPTVWHGFAHGRGGVFSGFAMKASAGHCFRAGQRQPSHDLRSQRCYPSPSPSLRSGPSQAGPFLVRKAWHVCASGIRNCFEMPAIAVESAAITTNLRGSTKCRSRLSSSLFFPRPWPVACRTPRRAAWPVRQLARLSPTPWMKTCSPGPLWAGWLALPLVASRSACRPATRATDLTAFGRVHLTPGTIRADRPGGPFAFRLGGADV